MESKSSFSLDAPIVRLSLMVLVTILLNFGLFFILNFLAPLVTGLVVGFLIAKIRYGVAVGFIGNILSYCIVFVMTEWFIGFTTPLLDVAIAVLIMGGIGAGGGLIGSLISMRMRS